MKFTKRSATSIRGYVDPFTRVKESINAGLILEEWRKGNFDFPDGETGQDTETMGVPPRTRDGDYEISEAHNDWLYVKDRMRKRAISQAKFMAATLEKERIFAEKSEKTGSTGDRSNKSPPIASSEAREDV